MFVWGTVAEVNVTKICSGCGIEFQGHPVKRFCTQQCWIRYKNRIDIDHQRSAGRKGGKVRGEQQKAARTTDWYDKQDGRHVHRVVAERILSRSLESAEIVHHEDQNKRNNDPANLIVFPSQAVHARHHKLNHCGTPCDCPGIRLGVVPNATS